MKPPTAQPIRRTHRGRREAIGTYGYALLRTRARQLIALRERPGARDGQDVGVALDIRRKGRVRSGHFHDLERRGVEHAVRRLVIDLDVLERAVAPDRHSQHEAAIELL